jgi:hypothetical protein
VWFKKAKTHLVEIVPDFDTSYLDELIARAKENISGGFSAPGTV